MADKIVTVGVAIIYGGVAIRIMTNRNSAATTGAIFHGVGEDIHASFG